MKSRKEEERDRSHAKSPRRKLTAASPDPHPPPRRLCLAMRPKQSRHMCGIALPKRRHPCTAPPSRYTRARASVQTQDCATSDAPSTRANPSARPGRDPALASCRIQREACFRFIASHIDQRWVPVAESFDDEGESGASIERPAFMRLLQRVDQGLVDQVVVHRLDRLTRNARDWARIQMHLEPRNLGVAVVTGSVQTGTTALAGFQLNMLAAIAEFEREMIADRLRDARAARKQRGLRSAGRVPFGYSSDPHTRQLLIVPSEAEIVRMAFRLAAADLNPSQIARSLNDGPHATPETPRRWHPRTVLRMLATRPTLGSCRMARPLFTTPSSPTSSSPKSPTFSMAGAHVPHLLDHSRRAPTPSS